MTHDVMRTKKAIDSFTLARARQVVNHGFTSARDDRNNGGNELSLAAASYCVAYKFSKHGEVPNLWPWDASWFKPAPADDTEARKRDLEKAGALLIAEWERLDRIQERRAEEEVT